MLKIFSKRTLSLVLSVLMLMALVPMVSAEDATTTATDYETIIAEGTLYSYEDMTGETVKTAAGTGIVTGAGAHGFTDNTTPKSTRGAIVPSIVKESTESTNDVLMFTGQSETGEDNVFTSVYSRAVFSGAGKYDSNAKGFSGASGIQMWEAKVKIPATINGEFMAFGWGEGYTGNITASNQSGICIRNGGVYRITDEFEPGGRTGYPSGTYNMPYDVELLPEGTLMPDTWYTMIRIIDLRDPYCFYDRVYVFDAAGELLSDIDTPWKKVGCRQANYFKTGTEAMNPAISFFARNFKAGENVMVDDFNVYKIATAPSYKVEVNTGNATANKFLAMDAVNTATLRFGWLCMGKGTQHYTADIYLPVIDEGSKLYMFSPNFADNGEPTDYNSSFAILDGVAYTGYGSTNRNGKEENYTTTVIKKADGSNLTLAAKTWYTLTYEFDILTGSYTATVIDKASGTVLATQTGTRPDKLEAYTGGGDTRLLSLAAASGFSGKVLFDNLHIKAVKDGTTQTYTTKDYTFESDVIGSYTALNATSGDLQGAKTLVVTVDTEANYLLTGAPLASPADALPISVIGDINDVTFTSEYIKLYDGETEVPDALILDSEAGTIGFKNLMNGKTYTLKLTNLESGDEPLNLLLANQTLTIAIAEGIFEIKSLGLSGGVAALPATGNISGAVSISNATSDDQPIALILALYNDEEGLVDVAVWSDTVEAGDTTYEEATEALSVAGADYAKVMLWDGFQTLVPLTGDVVISPAAAQ